MSMRVAGYQTSGALSGRKALDDKTAKAASNVKTADYGVQRLKPKSNMRRKKLNYNSREIRSALMRASKSQSAGMVLSTAKSKLVSLLKCKGCGMYNESELNTAIVHARRMVQCAKIKVRHLSKEEQEERRNEKAAQEEGKGGMERLQKEMRYQQRKMALARKRRMHRQLERIKMDQADEEYKNKSAQNQKEQGTVSMTGVCDLSDLELQKLELEMSQEEAALQMEAGMEGVVEAAFAMGIDPAAVGGTETGGSQTGVTPQGVGDMAGGVIDICL